LRLASLLKNIRQQLSKVAERIREKADGSFTLGGFDGEALVGIATFKREAGIKERHKGHILGVYVSASHRGRGFGGELIGALLVLAKKRSVAGAGSAGSWSAQRGRDSDLPEIRL
jgi:ribosomal protein S18 acetylase RimI-like enzyme